MTTSFARESELGDKNVVISQTKLLALFLWVDSTRNSYQWNSAGEEAQGKWELTETHHCHCVSRCKEDDIHNVTSLERHLYKSLSYTTRHSVQTHANFLTAKNKVYQQNGNFSPT